MVEKRVWIAELTRKKLLEARWLFKEILGESKAIPSSSL